jgi:hypothetical protein
MTPCDTCGKTQPTHPHYRLSRANRGNTQPHNTIHTCDDCTYRAQTPPGEQLGWNVRRGNDPAVIPYFRLSDETWRQWDGGRIRGHQRDVSCRNSGRVSTDWMWGAMRFRKEDSCKTDTRTAHSNVSH